MGNCETTTGGHQPPPPGLQRTSFVLQLVNSFMYFGEHFVCERERERERERLIDSLHGYIHYGGSI